MSTMNTMVFYRTFLRMKGDLLGMTLKEYYEMITDTEKYKQYLDRICKQVSRGFILISLSGAEASSEMIGKVLSAFNSCSSDLTFFDAASVSKLITDSSLKQHGIIIKEAQDHDDHERS